MKKRLVIIVAGIFLLSLAGLALYGLHVRKQRMDYWQSRMNQVALAGVTVDWVEIGDAFYLEVRNDSAQPFMLDKFFMEDFNIEITGFDSEFKKVHESLGGYMEVQRLSSPLVIIAPGNHHRILYRLEEALKDPRRNIKYIKLKWSRQERGSALPKAGLETSFYELRKEPGPRKEERIPAADFRSWKEKEAQPGITIDWVEIDNVFYLEVKNGSTQPFMLDELFLEGNNVHVIGLDAKCKPVYKTIVKANVQRALGNTLFRIAPGNYHRTAYEIDRSLRTLPQQVKYIKLKWHSNDMGTPFTFKLPGLDEKGRPLVPIARPETSLHDVRKPSGPPAAVAGK